MSKQKPRRRKHRSQPPAILPSSRVDDLDDVDELDWFDDLPDPGLMTVPDLRLMERQTAGLHRLLAQHEFESVEEANEFLQEALAFGDLRFPPPETPEERAQDLVYQAIEAEGRKRDRLLKQALALWPDCAEAYVVMSESAKSPEEARELLWKGVEAGERALGPEAFEEAAGHFWGILETRPYMRARAGLATALWTMGERQEAIGHAQELLRLNPGDNQGNRYLLAAWLMTVDDVSALEGLLKQYPEERSAAWAYAGVYLAYRRYGPGRQAKAALKEALRVNPYVPVFCSGAVPLPDSMPASYSPGSPEEAFLFLAEAVGALNERPDITGWMVDESLSALQSLTRPRKGRKFSWEP